MKLSVRRAFTISFLERYSITILNFISVMVLARLLTPEDIGIYSVGLAIIGLAHMIRDFGIGDYLLQEKTLTREKVASALGLTIVLAWSLGFVIFALSGAVADYYEESSVKEVIQVVALNFFLIPLGAMAPSLLKRGMSFGTLFKINFSASFTNIIVAISLAYMGYGFMSMAWASVSSIFVRAVLGQYFLPKKYRILPSLNGWPHIAKFGGHIVGANLSRELGQSIPDLIVSKVLGFSALGYFSRAQGYVKLYTTTIQKAIVPVIQAMFAKNNREDSGLQNSYLKTVSYVTLIGWSLLAFLGLMSFQIIRLLYGDQWDAAVPVASVLCLATAFVVPSTINVNLLIATGHAKPLFRISLVLNLIRIASVVALVSYGLVYVAYGLVIVSMLQFIISSYAVSVNNGLKIGKLLPVFIKNISIILISMVVPLFMYLMPGFNLELNIKYLVLACGYTSIIWLLMLYVFKHPFREEIDKVVALVLKKVTN